MIEEERDNSKADRDSSTWTSPQDPYGCLVLRAGSPAQDSKDVSLANWLCSGPGLVGRRPSRTDATREAGLHLESPLPAHPYRSRSQISHSSVAIGIGSQHVLEARFRSHWNSVPINAVFCLAALIRGRSLYLAATESNCCSCSPPPPPKALPSSNVTPPNNFESLVQLHETTANPSKSRVTSTQDFENRLVVYFRHLSSSSLITCGHTTTQLARLTHNGVPQVRQACPASRGLLLTISVLVGY